MNVNQAEWARTAREVPKFAFVEDVSDSYLQGQGELQGDGSLEPLCRVESV